MSSFYSQSKDNQFLVVEEAKKTLEKQQKDFEKLIEEIKRYNEKQKTELKKTNPYAVELAKMQEDAEKLNISLGDYKDAKEKVLAIDKWYSEEYEKLQNKKNNMTAEDYSNSVMGLENLRQMRFNEANDEVWQGRGEKIGSIFSDELTKILTEYGDFEIGMKNITKRLYAYIVKEAVNAMLQQVMGLKVMEAVKNALSSGGGGGMFGIAGAAGSLVKGIARGIGFKFHSGGIMPTGANTEIPGADEQLALLKGGERILSPSENTDYNSNSQSNSSPVVFNNFNVKAWDSKDVQKYLLDNKDLLNSITYDGIKNNSGQLRQIVRYA